MTYYNIKKVGKNAKMTDIATVCYDKYLFVRFDYVCDDGRY